jgi:protein-S-isoprenylcysteine O-methyltransferase Ste14
MMPYDEIKKTVLQGLHFMRPGKESIMSRKLFVQGIVKFVSGVLLLGLLLFGSAGTFSYWQAWLLMGILFIPMFLAGLVMMKKNPELLKKRLNVKEEQSEQREVILYSGIMFLAAFIAAGLNERFGWIRVPAAVSYTGAVLFLLSYALYGEVLRENAYLSRTIEVQENQKVIDTGLYGIVRHPMYMSTLVLFLSMPLVLGSVISFVIMLAYIPIIAKRIRNEEEVLEEGLPGYKEYKKKVHWKVIPYIW